MKHKHYDLIIAWANGALIQRKLYINDDFGNSVEWSDAERPSWCDDVEYRIKPKDPLIHYYRLWLNKVKHINSKKFQYDVSVWNGTHIEASFNHVEKLESFVKWLSPLTPVEIPHNE
jgi:hypothetical protein